MSHTSELSIPVETQVLQNLLTQARWDPLIECCGFLAGRAGVVSTVLSARNAVASATAYEVAPDELFALFRRMRENGLDHLGIYHSHPNSDNAPSPTDIERAYYPDAVYFIISPRPEATRPVRAFRIVSGKVDELEIEEI